MTIRIELVKQEIFYPKQIVNESKEKSLEWEWEKGYFGRRKKIQVEKEVTKTKYTIDWEGMKDLPEDALQYFKTCDFKENKGWNYWSGYHYEQTKFIRPFTITLNKFYKDNKITQKNLIKIDECKAGCTITASYITWDDGE